MLTKEIFRLIRSKILLSLGDNLSKDLFYHCLGHTIDVEKQAERIAIHEKISGEQDLLLLKIACLYHDSGFIDTYNEHELAGCERAKNELTAFGISKEELSIIGGLIMATKIPQTPLTKLEEIICDADLDYLGRNDFFPISHSLYLELKAKNFIASEHDWNLIQIKFFRQHNYFTATTKKLREQKKLQHLEMIEGMLENA